jgi:protein O-mannosyl-transferase
MIRPSAKWLVLIPVVLALAVHFNVLQNGFVWDDIVLLTEEGRTGMAQQAAPESYYRPVGSMSYRMDRKLWDQNPFGYHLTGLALHACATLLVTLLGLRLFAESPRRVPIATFAGLLFAVHPVHAEAVAWIAGRNDLLPTVFLLIAALAHLAGRQGTRAVWTFPVFLSAMTLALLSKETAAPYLLVFPLYDLLLWPRPGPRWRRLLTPSTGLLVFLGLVYVILRIQTLGNLTGRLPLREGGLGDHLHGVLSATGFYMKHLIFPYPLNVFIGLPEMTSAIGTLYTGLGLLAFLAAAGLTFWGRGARFAIGLWSVLLGLAAPLVLSMTTLVHVPVAERYLYLPSVGFVYIAAGGLFALSNRLRDRHFVVRPQAILLIAATTVLMAFSYASYHRNQVWLNETALWEDAVRKSPRAALPHNRLGKDYVRAGRLEDAQREFLLALEGQGYPGILASAAINLGGTYYEQGRLELAEEAYLTAIEHEDRTQPHFGLGIIYLDRARKAQASQDAASPALWSKARVHLVNAVVRDDSNIQAYHALSLIDLALGDREAERRNLRKVVALNPESPLGRDAARRLEEIHEPQVVR